MSILLNNSLESVLGEILNLFFDHKQTKESALLEIVKQILHQVEVDLHLDKVRLLTYILLRSDEVLLYQSNALSFVVLQPQYILIYGILVDNRLVSLHRKIVEDFRDLVRGWVNNQILRGDDKLIDMVLP